jgi:HlyD family secretion protein
MADEGKPDLPLPVAKGETEPKSRNGGSSRRWTWPLRGLVVLLLIFLGGIFGLYFQPIGLQKFFEATSLEPGAGSNAPIALPRDVTMTEEMAAAIQPTDVVGLARLLPRGDISIVALPFGAGDARVAEILVSIGDAVARGDVVARLDNATDLESDILAAEAEVAIRAANLLQTRQSVVTSLAETRANLEQAQAAADEARSELERVTALRDRGVATQANLDQATSAEAQARQAVAAARAALSRYEYDDIETQPDVQVAQSNLDAARIQLERARRELSKSRVASPIGGTVLDIHVTPGERVGEDGLMEVGDIETMMAEIEVYQTQVGDVVTGQPVEIAAEALNRTLRGTVVRIGLTVGRQGIIADDVAANTDAKVVTVLAELDAESSRLARGYTDLEVIARIETEVAE